MTIFMKMVFQNLLNLLIKLKLFSFFLFKQFNIMLTQISFI